MAGHPAVLPQVAAPRGVPIDGTGLRAWIEPEGSVGKILVDLTEWPGSETVRRQLIAALARICGPTGSWRAEASVRSRVYWLKPFAAWTGVAGVHDLDDLRPADWLGPQGFVTFLATISTSPPARNSWSGTAKRVLEHHAGLSAATMAVLDRKYQEPTTQSTAGHYDLDLELGPLYRTSLTVLGAAHRRVSANWALVTSDADLLSDDQQVRRAALIEVLETGRPSTRQGWESLGAWRRVGAVNSEWRVPRIARSSLFLSPVEAHAAAVLLMAATGENLSTLQRRTVADTSPTAGDSAVTVYSSVLDKPRRGPGARFIAENPLDVVDDPDPGAVQRSAGAPNSGRGLPDSRHALGPSLRRVTAATEPAREARRRRGLPGADRLLVWSSAGRGLTHSFAGATRARDAGTWMPDGIRLDFAKLHRTVMTRQRRRPVHNSMDTYLNRYLLSDPLRRAELDATVEAGLTLLVDSARSTTLLRVVAATEASTLIRSGRMDTGVGACSDLDRDPLTGLPCVHDNHLACLGCANGVATERHLPLLVTLFDQLERVRAAPGCTETEWDHNYATAWSRLFVILEQAGARLVQHARQQRTSEHEAAVGRLLTGVGWQI